MNTIYFDPPLDDAIRRQRLYRGHLIAHSPTASGRAFVAFAREMLEPAFAPFDPRDAQQALKPAEFAGVLAELKPRFIHHPRSKTFIRTLLEELGCDLDQLYFDVPRMRSATSDN